MRLTRLLVYVLLLPATLIHAGESRIIDYVNPFIGTSNFGTTNPGAICPNGMMSVTPFNVMGSDTNVWDKDSRWWSTPYSSDNSFFTGFSHINLSGVGCPEVGLALTMPTAGALNVDYHMYGSEAVAETARPGYYGCELVAYGIKAEASATTRTSIERYTFPKGQGNILVNFGDGLTNESGAWLRKISETEIEGMRLAGTFCYNPQAVFPVYFAIRINKVPSKGGFWKKQPLLTGVEAEWTPDDGTYKIYQRYGREIAGDEIGYWFSFETAEGEAVELQMGVSFVSCENAWENLEAEQARLQPGVSNFEAVRAEAEAAWEADLGRIKVEGGSERDKEVFYSALYHALIHPSILNDVNGEYPLMENDGVGRVPSGQNRYSVFSLWDTYRNLHQLMTLVYPERQMDMVRSMIDIYREWGWMPKWELFGRETFTMEGDPSIPVIADTWLKGLRDFDIETAYAAFVKSATTPGADNLMRPDIDPYLEKGYVPLGFYSADASGDNSVSHALEYYIADYALSLLAADLGYADDAAKFRAQSLQYKHYYCPTFGTLRPLNADGTFLEPFNPRQGENFEPVPGFHEGSAWNYTFYVPHDVLGLAKLMGGRKAFVNKLQKVFDEGLYDPANEPDIAYPYLFSYFKGEEWRTAKIVSELLDKHYTTRPDGIPGNDDTGTMSAWAVFSMMGFYPDCPGDPSYTLTVPRFDRVEITLDPAFCNGNDRLVITKTAKMKGRISHKDLVSGRLPVK
ncbi:MAG: GH92 family glycosyl hydrolase [Bacteroidales bacterium]|nr:GH92 family glycosyl hydrolase [Bacteroidales bacterium]